MDWHVLRFEPIYKERVWGGTALRELYGRVLPVGGPFGESWEITDRPEGVSRVAEGPWAGRTLAELMTADARGLLGDTEDRSGRFPLLVKILDAREALSLQVHPPAPVAARLGGESKTEMWYFTASKPGSVIHVGLRAGTTREVFEQRLRVGKVAECFHRIEVRPGDAMFLPSGRVHALGAGLVLFEIQENSDTTYRLFDWNRLGLDGRPRELHLAQSLESMDFADQEPGLVSGEWVTSGEYQVRTLVGSGPFRVGMWRARAGLRHEFEVVRCGVVGVVAGRLRLGGGRTGWEVELGPGEFAVLPAGMKRAWWAAAGAGSVEWLMAEPRSRGSGEGGGAW